MLEIAFQASKLEIIQQCEKAVHSLILDAPTILETDWLKIAVVCWLVQKFYSCKATLPGCCHTGWQTVHVASKFNLPTVAGYHPIEGEAYAAVWALEKLKILY